MWRACQLIVIATLLGCWTQPCFAADSPARLAIAERSIEELLSLPRKLEPGRYAVNCEGYVLISGYVPYVYCYAMDAPAPASLIDAVIAAAVKARYVPARREESLVEVYMLFKVLIDTTLAEPLILAVPNNGVQRQKYGLLYTSPQRVMKKPGPAAGLFGRAWGESRRAYGVRPDSLVWMQIQVDAQGKVRDFRLNNLTDAASRTMQLFEREVATYEFLPGYFEGQPVPMLYVEPVFSIN